MVGILWFDDDPHRDLREKVGDAARRYAKRFGRHPTVCYVHPSVLNGSGVTLDFGDFCLRVEARRSVLRHHFFVGEADAGSPGQP